ncbi:MAG: hypothetical protein IRY99_21825 [Isosphaeraceae bacterium]|nr:hypothetical protein [Isosphaeraceae bacterium]
MYETVFDGIRFIEGRPAKARVIEPVRIELGGVIRSSQLKNLDDVKRAMADRARARGGNAVIDFKYGQRSVGILRSLFQRDDVNWYGEGVIAVVS